MLPSPRPLALRALVAAVPLVLTTCILDLSGLSDGKESGSGGSVPSGSGGSAGAGMTAAGGTATGMTTGGSSGAMTASGGTAGSGATTGSGTTGGSGGGGGCSPLSCDGCEAPTVLATGPALAATPLGIAVAPAGDALYWVNEATGTIMRMLDDGSPAAPIATGAVLPRSIAAGVDLVVWSAKDGVWACPPAACAPSKKKLASSSMSNSIREVAYDGTYVYWTDGATGGQDGLVKRCDPASCQPKTLATMQWNPVGVTAVGNAALWTDQAGQYEDGRIMKCQQPCPEEIAAGLLQPTGIAADGVTVFWTQYNPTGKVMRCPHTIGFCDKPTDVAPALGPLTYPRDVALAGGRVYFSTTEADGAIRSCPSPGCAAGQMPKVHASGRPSLHRMTVGLTCVFFTDETNGGSVVKVAR